MKFVLLFSQRKISVVENVMGFGYPEGGAQTQSPLQGLLRYFATYLSEYSARVYVMRGSTYLPFDRRRIWIVCIMNKYGGEQSHRHMKAMLEEQCTRTMSCKAVKP